MAREFVDVDFSITDKDGDWRPELNLTYRVKIPFLPPVERTVSVEVDREALSVLVEKGRRLLKKLPDMPFG